MNQQQQQLSFRIADEQQTIMEFKCFIFRNYILEK